jgi:hypothetical protein
MPHYGAQTVTHVGQQRRQSGKNASVMKLPGAPDPLAFTIKIPDFSFDLTGKLRRYTIWESSGDQFAMSGVPL